MQEYWYFFSDLLGTYNLRGGSLRNLGSERHSKFRVLEIVRQGSNNETEMK